MQRQEALGAVIGLDGMIARETERLQSVRDNDKLDDPSKLPVLNVKRQSPVTPHMITMSAELIARNAALKAIGDCDNYADEENALANIAEAEGKVYEADDTTPKTTPDKKEKATK